MKPIVFTGLFLAAFASECNALPTGKAWSQPSILGIPGYTHLSAPRIDHENGILRAATLPRGPSERSDARGFRWSGKDWVETWRMAYGTLAFWPVLAPSGQTHLIWEGVSPGTTGLLMIAELEGDALGRVDTIARTSEIRPEYAAAISSTRKWAAVCDKIERPNAPPQTVQRVFRKTPRSSWIEVPASGMAGYGTAIAPLDEKTALFVWADLRERLQWAVLKGTKWQPRGLLHDERVPERPRLRRRPSGGYWLSWGTSGPNVFLNSFRNGRWGKPIRITADYPRLPHDQNLSNDTDMSRDDAEFPVVAWDADYEARSQIFISYPTPSGYARGEMVPGSGGGVMPSVARDSNGDVWMTWWEEGRATWWTHTYTRATCSRPRIEARKGRRCVVWSLSEPAPEAWWSVLASRNEGPYEVIGRTQASAGLEVAWEDNSPPAENLRYKIRRDCLDENFQWESEPVAHPDSGRALK